MKIIHHNPQWARVQATHYQMMHVAAQPDPVHFRCDPNEQCLFTYAKVYYLGGGWWDIKGYDHDGRDVTRVLDRLQDNFPHATITKKFS